MGNTILKVENISKQYRLGLVGTRTLKDDLKRWWYTVRGKEDPFLKVGDTNIRAVKSTSEYVWALQNISFEVERGEVLGIIGKNGAGKSTLLKLLSRITSPTTGTIYSKGSVASLLEVGTGFHPELTGRENIYLNGAILGMTKKEIASKIDEIVSFSGCQRYIDTPVKRYSSGMRVRLGFAVAAHLEPDILIVDEVLAVGDAEFQKKAIGKMKDISSGEGRTVLFVSHNMDSIMRLCTKAILLKDGLIQEYGSTAQIINSYLKSDFDTTSFKKWGNNFSDNLISPLEVKAHDKEYNLIENCLITEEVGITFTYKVNIKKNKIHAAFNFYNSSGINIFDSHETNTVNYGEIKDVGIYDVTVWIPKNLLSEGIVLVGVALTTHDPFEVHFHEKDVIAFNMVDSLNESPTRGEYVGSMEGVIRPHLKWDSKKR